MYFFSSWSSARWYWPVQWIQGHPTIHQNWSKTSPCLAAKQGKIWGRTVQWWRWGRRRRAVWCSRCKATAQSWSDVKTENKDNNQPVWWWWTRRRRWFLCCSSSFQGEQVMKLWSRSLKRIRSQCTNFETVITVVAPLWCIETSAVFFTVVHVSVGVCLLFSVTTKKEPSKDESKEKVKVTKLLTFLLNRNQDRS